MKNCKKVVLFIFLFLTGCVNFENLATHLTVTPMGGAIGRVLLFGDLTNKYKTLFPQNNGTGYFYKSDWNGRNLSPLTPYDVSQSFHLEKISPNKELLLLSIDAQGASDAKPFGETDLFVIDINHPEKNPIFLEKGRYIHAGARWMDDHTVLYAAENDDYSINLFTINIDNLEKKLFFKPGVKQNISRILNINESSVYWIDSYYNYWTAKIDGTNPHIIRIEKWGKGDNWSAIQEGCAVSPDGKWFAWQVDNWKGLHTVSTEFYLYSLIYGTITKIKEIPLPSPEYPYALLFSESNLVIIPNSVNDYNGIYFSKIPIYVIKLISMKSIEVDINYSNYKVTVDEDSYSLSADGRLLILNTMYDKKNHIGQLGGMDTKVINLDSGRIYTFNAMDFRHVIWI